MESALDNCLISAKLLSSSPPRGGTERARVTGHLVFFPANDVTLNEVCRVMGLEARSFVSLRMTGHSE